MERTDKSDLLGCSGVLPMFDMSLRHATTENSFSGGLMIGFIGVMADDK